MWGRAGKGYDEVSFAISDVLAHATQRLNARAGERILNVATGTGWSARNVARRGAAVTGVDISPELLAAAADISAHIRPPIEFRLADAEQLPFDDGVFYGIISTFGVIFAVIWDWYTRGFGPLRQLAETLPQDRVQRLKKDIDAYHRHNAVPAGLHVKREYLFTIGQRR